MKTKFEEPPINELIIGAYFSENVPMRSEHIGLFWSLISSKYPKSQQAGPLSNVEMNDRNEVFPMPRYWFISDDESRLVQIQKNCLLFNWRKREDEYPHFDVLKQEFHEVFTAFQYFCSDVLDQKELPIDTIELTYVNFINENEYWSELNAAKNIVPTTSAIGDGIIEGELIDFAHRQKFQVEEDLQLFIDLQSRKSQNEDEPSNTLYLELRTQGILSGVSIEETHSWFDKAHDTIGKTFINITSSEVHTNVWKYKGE